MSLWACGEERPCGACPPVEGQYELAYGEVEKAGGCEEAPKPPAVLELTRFGSTLRAKVGEIDLAGTLYDTGAFRLSGADEASSIQLRGSYLPPSSITDGGTGLRGTYTVWRGLGEASCYWSWPFGGLRR